MASSRDRRRTSVAIQASVLHWSFVRAACGRPASRIVCSWRRWAAVSFSRHQPPFGGQRPAPAAPCHRCPLSPVARHPRSPEMPGHLLATGPGLDQPGLDQPGLDQPGLDQPVWGQPHCSRWPRSSASPRPSGYLITAAWRTMHRPSAKPAPPQAKIVNAHGSPMMKKSSAALNYSSGDRRMYE